MTYLKLIFLLLFSSLIYAKPIIINENTNFKEILSSSEIYIDKTEKLTVFDIKDGNYLFKYNDSSTLSFGYSPKLNVWIKFTLYNNSDKPIHKIIEYANPLTTNIEVYDPNKNYKKEESGLVFKNSNKNTVNPIFSIDIKPKENVTYFIKASSHITTLIVKLNLWSDESFFKKEIKHQIILTLFFGAMFILAIYNLFIYFFTKDISYLYYVFYIFGVIIHHLLYVGIANIYFLEPNLMIKTIEAASVVVAIPVIALGLFTKSFLQIKQYPIHNKILNTFLILIPISIIFFLLTDDYDKYRNLLTLLLMFYLIFITIYSALKKNRQAYFILFGWCLIFLALLFMFLSSQGIFNIHQYFSYYIETTLVLEALVFSIALADKINNLQKEKNEANDKLLTQQKNETERLSKEVALRTKDLKHTVDEKELLLKELNHRVKNNMQMIVSLIRLQADDIKDKKLNEVLLTIQNRIKAMSHLHELLYKQDNITYINAYEYFDILIEEVKETYEDDIYIHLDIQTELKMEHAIYCGLILNELITNSFKYAFPNKEGDIYIELKQKNNKINLTVKDNGIGYKNKSSNGSLGLILVTTLSKNQLKGEINIDSSNGVTTEIFWNNDD